MTRLDTWNQLQANGLKAYREIPEASCALAWRRDVRQFKRFIGRQDGFTLDIGCGIEVPGYLDKHNLRHTVGIDPLPAAVCFAPMQRFNDCGEDLSEFLDSAADLIILAGTLDHVLSPTKVLAEARRVLRPDGRIVVQIGIPDNIPIPNTFRLLYLLYSTVLHSLFSKPKPTVDHEKIRGFVQALPVPAGCPDPFHFKYYTEAEIETLFGAAQLRITRRKRIPGKYVLRVEEIMSIKSDLPNVVEMQLADWLVESIANSIERFKTTQAASHENDAEFHIPFTQKRQEWYFKQLSELAELHRLAGVLSARIYVFWEEVNKDDQEHLKAMNEYLELATPLEMKK